MDGKTRARAIKNITHFYCGILIGTIEAYNAFEYLEK
jgi:hypothetical protein